MIIRFIDIETWLNIEKIPRNMMIIVFLDILIQTFIHSQKHEVWRKMNHQLRIFDEV